jgi:hypothetical protein
MMANQYIKRQKPFLVRKAFLTLLFLYIVYCWVIIHTYDFQLAEQNAYVGMQPWAMTSVGWGALAITLLFAVRTASRVRGNPSDFFVVFYSAIPVISLLSLISTSGKINNQILLPSLLIIIFPLLMIQSVFFKYLVPKLTWRGLVASIFIERLILAILLTVIMYLYVNSPVSAGFDMGTSWIRRLEGRELYAAGSLIAYASGMCMNGLTPYLAFKAAVNGRRLLLLTAFGSAVFFYWLVGVKAPIMYVFVAYSIGFLSMRNMLPNLIKYFIFIIITLYFFVLLEWLIFYNYSMVADYGFRRIFPVQAAVQGYYLDFLLSDPPLGWDWLFGILDQSFQVTYFIGENYYGNSNSNVNTNAFLYAFASKGISGYLFAIFFVLMFLALLDRLYQSTDNPGYLFIGFIYGVLIMEQAFSTAIVTSGVGLLFLLTILEKYRSPLDVRSHANKVKNNKAFQ